ncbi:biosynthetic-type acetolactate synthase large subunit [Desulfovibrio litoralis]|uniref:Acetolactate synthase n=1 Tax=Desulfovibrio litoralis DSM 11393 TaxID=1121455 RepID=A0A1M7TI15_9BACT|nr:biosynthetic-type acetolactate synthase large subunit [Desulfovibrio litoralis]SHN70419.1 acetolactate synthase, large subunit [Desulfovibrio litoralis DSM 11393]
MELTGAQILMECLKKEGVDVFFGYPGGAVIDLYDELLNHPELQHVLVRHEQAAVHAADGYARTSGKVGVCLVTSGPGATNTVTGIATAYADSIPLVILTGQVPTHLIGNDAFQEVDIIGITRPCTKHNYLVKDIKQLPKVIKEAFFLARSGRPGPVLIDFPKNVMTAKTEFHYPEEIARLRSYNPTYKPNLNQLRKAVDLLLNAKKPLFFIGGGVIQSGASESLDWLAKNLHIPVTASLMGLGGYPGDDPLWLGMLGMHGTYSANRATSEADLIVAIGARFDDRATGKLTGFAKAATIVHIDIDPTSIQKNVQVDVPVVGDCRESLLSLRSIVEPRINEKDWKSAHGDWLAQIFSWKADHPVTYNETKNTLNPQKVIETIYELTKGEAIICTEVGQHQMWTAQFFTFKQPRSLVTSGGLGTMGFGFPASLGAQMAFPDKLVIDIAGDGSIQMNSQELATAVFNKLPVKIVILNNGFLGMVRQWQELFYDNRYSSVNLEAAAPDFVKLAEAYGAEGYRVNKPEELVSTLTKAFASPNTVIVDVIVNKEENVYPMVPPNASLNEMLL